MALLFGHRKTIDLYRWVGYARNMLEHTSHSQPCRLQPQVVHEATFEAAMEEDARTLGTSVDPWDPMDPLDLQCRFRP